MLPHRPSPIPFPQCTELAKILRAGDVDSFEYVFIYFKEHIPLAQLQIIFSHHIPNLIPLGEIEVSKNLKMLKAYKDALLELFGNSETMMRILTDQINMLKRFYRPSDTTNPVIHWIKSFNEDAIAALDNLDKISQPEVEEKKEAPLILEQKLNETDPVKSDEYKSAAANKIIAKPVRAAYFPRFQFSLFPTHQGKNPVLDEKMLDELERYFPRSF